MNKTVDTITVIARAHDIQRNANAILEHAAMLRAFQASNNVITNEPSVNHSMLDRHMDEYRTGLKQYLWLMQQAMIDINKALDE